jgi:hypothetical protein
VSDVVKKRSRQDIKGDEHHQRQVLALVTEVWNLGNASPQLAAEWCVNEAPKNTDYEAEAIVEAMLCVALANHPLRTLLIAYKEEAVYQDSNLLLHMKNNDTGETVEIHLARDMRKLFLPRGSSLYSLDVAALAQGWNHVVSKLSPAEPATTKPLIKLV